MSARPGIQERVARQLGVDKSLVSKIARGLYNPATARGAMVVARVNIALAREWARRATGRGA